MTDNKEKLVAELVNKGLDGDMDAVNACEDKMIRAKAKAMIVKVGKGTAERPPMPVTNAVNDASSDVPEHSSSIEINKDVNQYIHNYKCIYIYIYIIHMYIENACGDTAAHCF